MQVVWGPAILKHQASESEDNLKNPFKINESGIGLAGQGSNK